MIHTLNLLFEGDENILNYYESAKDIWNDILQEFQPLDIETLSKELQTKQLGEFEPQCGGRGLGKEIMAVVSLLRFYDLSIGFDNTRNEALIVYKAIQKSSCSVELKNEAKNVADLLYLDPES